MSGCYHASATPLPAVGLRLASEVGRAALGRVGQSGPTALAELDQHLAAVRDAITDSEACYRPAAAAAARAATDARIGQAPACDLDGTRSPWPDVPRAADTVSAEPPLPLDLLHHYACGFLEEAVIDGWWPACAAAAASLDWQSMRLAALCQLTEAAEAAEQVPPDLYF